MTSFFYALTTLALLFSTPVGADTLGVHKKLKIDVLKKAGLTGKGVKVAVLDVKNDADKCMADLEKPVERGKSAMSTGYCYAGHGLIVSGLIAGAGKTCPKAPGVAPSIELIDLPVPTTTTILKVKLGSDLTIKEAFHKTKDGQIRENIVLAPGDVVEYSGSSVVGIVKGKKYESLLEPFPTTCLEKGKEISCQNFLFSRKNSIVGSEEKEGALKHNMPSPFLRLFKTINAFNEKNKHSKIQIVNISRGFALTNDVVKEIKKFAAEGGIIVKAAGNAEATIGYVKGKGFQVMESAPYVSYEQGKGWDRATGVGSGASTSAMDTMIFKKLKEDPELRNAFLFVGNLDFEKNELEKAIVGKLGSNSAGELADRYVVAIGNHLDVLEMDFEDPVTHEWETKECGFVEKGGTSYAAPIVSGTLALLSEKYPGCSGQTLAKAVLLSADKIRPLGKDKVDRIYGAGRLNAEKALEVAGGLCKTKS